MASEKKFDVKVVISAVDNATAQFKEINKKIANSPLAKLSNSMRGFSKAAGLGELGASFKEVGAAAANVGSEAAALGAKLAAIGGVAGAGLFGLANNFAKFGDQVNDAAQSLGLTSAKYQEFMGAARLAGVDQDAMNTSLERFSKNIGEAAAGSGEALTAFRAMGISLTGPNGRLRTMDQLLPEAAKKLSSIQNAQVRAALGAKLFGKQFKTLVPLITDFQKKTDQAKQFVISEEDINAADQFTQKFDALKMVFGNVANLAGSKLLPGFEKAFAIIEKLLVDNSEAIKQFFAAVGENLPAIVESIASAVKTVAGYFSSFDEATGKVTLNMGRIKLAFLAVAAVMAGPLLLAIGNLGVAMWGAGTQLVLFGSRIAMLMTSGMRFIPLLASMSTVFTTLGTVFGVVKTFAIGMWAAITGPVGLVIAGVAALIGLGVLLYKKWEPFRNLIDGIWEKIKGVASAIANSKLATIMANAIMPGAGAAAQLINANAAPAVGTAGMVQGMGGGTTRQDATVTVNLPNMPRGSRVTTETTGGLDLGIMRGIAMVPQ